MILYISTSIFSLDVEVGDPTIEIENKRFYGVSLFNLSDVNLYLA